MRFLFSIALLGLLLSCNKEKKLLNRLNDHTWNIDQSIRSVIDQDGNETIFEDGQNAGTISIYDDPLGFDGLKEAHFIYTNYLGQTSDFIATFYVNEDATRVGFAGALCNSPFECDLLFTVSENKKKSQVWTAYGSDNTYFFPPDTYNANKVDHIKWQLRLSR